jgi:hypothetical protein
MFPSNNAIWLLLALLIARSSGQTFPAIAEVDILFPRNDTYAPTALMPVIFAIQNPAAAVSLDLALEWYLYQLEDGDVTGVGSGVITMAYVSTASSGPDYEYGSIYNLVSVEGNWSLFWVVGSINCTQFPVSNSSLPGHFQGNTVIFTTKNGAQTTDLVTTITNGSCASDESFTFNISKAEEVSVGIGTTVTTCAVLVSTSPTPSPNPCAAQLNPSGASSILASLTASACSWPTPLVNCTTKTAESIAVRLGGRIWVVATFGWLLYAIMG